MVLNTFLATTHLHNLVHNEEKIFRGIFDLNFKTSKFLNVDFARFGGPARTRTWDQYIMSVLL